jgi:hypothetical protein
MFDEAKANPKNDHACGYALADKGARTSTA